MAYVGKSKPTATVSARVFSGPNGTGELLADLGDISGGEVRIKAEESSRDLQTLKSALGKARQQLFRATRLKDEELMVEIKQEIVELETGIKQARAVFLKASKAYENQEKELHKKLKMLKDRRSKNEREV